MLFFFCFRVFVFVVRGGGFFFVYVLCLLFDLCICYLCYNVVLCFMVCLCFVSLVCYLCLTLLKPPGYCFYIFPATAPKMPPDIFVDILGDFPES